MGSDKYENCGETTKFLVGVGRHQRSKISSYSFVLVMYNIYIYPKMKSDAGAYCLDPMGHVIDQALEHMD